MYNNKKINKSITILILCAVSLPFIGFYTATYIEDEMFEPKLAASTWLLFMFMAIGALSLVNKNAVKYYQYSGLKPAVTLSLLITFFAAGWIANGAWYNYYFFSDYVYPEYTVYQDTEYPNQFYFEGSLEAKSGTTLIRRVMGGENVDWDKPIVLAIQSSGGSPQEAIIISEFISQYNIHIEVMGKCISACTFILLSSENRYIHPRAWIGFHATYMNKPDNEPNYDSPSLRFYDEFLEKHLSRIGVSSLFKEKATIEDAAGGFFPSYDVLQKEGVSNQDTRIYMDMNKLPNFAYIN